MNEYKDSSGYKIEVGSIVRLDDGRLGKVHQLSFGKPAVKVLVDREVIVVDPSVISVCSEYRKQ